MIFFTCFTHEKTILGNEVNLLTINGEEHFETLGHLIDHYKKNIGLCTKLTTEFCKKKKKKSKKKSVKRKSTETSDPPKKKKKVPNAPRSVMSAYAFFFQDKHATIKEENPKAKFGDISKIVSQLWKALGETERAVYEQKNAEDKLRYEIELKTFKGKKITRTHFVQK